LSSLKLRVTSTEFAGFTKANPATFIVSRTLATIGGGGNDVDYDLYNGAITGITGVQSSGVHTAPTFANGNGVGMSGLYQLSPGSAGYGMGVLIPNFNDQYAAPDMGAAQSGTAAMTFGVNGHR